MEEDIKVSDYVEWHGKYKGVLFEVVKWKGDYSAPELQKYDKGYTWNFYIHVKPRKKRYAKGWKEGTKRVDYYKMFPDVEMPGGITYFSETTRSGLYLTQKIGCDYAHSWDYENFGAEKLKENKLEWVLKDVKETIDKLPADLLPTPSQV